MQSSPWSKTTAALNLFIRYFFHQYFTSLCTVHKIIFLKILDFLNLQKLFLYLSHIIYWFRCFPYTALNMREYGFSLTRILLCKDKIVDFVLYGSIRVSKNPYSRIFYVVLQFFSNRDSYFLLQFQSSSNHNVKLSREYVAKPNKSSPVTILKDLLEKLF